MPCVNQLTVVLPTRNEAPNVPAFLASLPFEVALVVVDRSDDGTPALIRRLRPENTRALRRDAPLTEARQIGAQLARTEWLLFTDADVVFDTPYFARVARWRGADVLYGPKLSRGEYASYYRRFAHGQGLLQTMGIPAASGSNLLIRRSAFDAVGGFDIGLPCNEDSEIVRRLHRAGHSCRFDPSLVAWGTDHRRLHRGTTAKTVHSLARCALLYSGLLPQRWREHDWGYWSHAGDGSS